MRTPTNSRRSEQYRFPQTHSDQERVPEMNRQANMFSHTSRIMGVHVLIEPRKGLMQLRLKPIKRTCADVNRWFDYHLESVILVATVVSFVLMCTGVNTFFSFQMGNNVNTVLATIVQSLASIFAIVFSISLVAIQLCSENLSHRLIGLFVRNQSFVIPFSANLAALLLNLILLSNSSYQHLADYGVVASIFAVLSLILFFVFTVRFLGPVRVVRELLSRIKTNDLLSRDFREREVYRERIQPIEDIISNCVQKGDYAAAQDSIDLVEDKMYQVLAIVQKKMKEENSVHSARMVTFMSGPFARLLERTAIASNKKDAIEITSYIVKAIGDYVARFPDARFISAFKIFDETIEHVFFQATYRFRSREYATDLALLNEGIATARVHFSEFTG
jgi:hypothetical protein